MTAVFVPLATATCENPESLPIYQSNLDNIAADLRTDNFPFTRLISLFPNLDTTSELYFVS